MMIEDKIHRVVLKEEPVLFSFIEFNDSGDKNLLMSIKRVIPDGLAKTIEISMKDSFVKRVTSVVKDNLVNELLKNHKRYISFNTTKNRVALYEFKKGKGSFFIYGEFGMIIDENYGGIIRSSTVKILTKDKNFGAAFKLVN